MRSDVVIDAFVDKIREKLDADEFEQLMVGGKNPDVMGSVRDNLDLMDLRFGWWDDNDGPPPALKALKASRAMERLQGRYPEQWEQAVMSEAVEV